MSAMENAAFETGVAKQVVRLAEILMQKQAMLACAESCTGGWLAKLCTDLAGSSQWFDRGFVTYSNAAKQDMLGVSLQTLEQHGAVSEQVAGEMASGVLARSQAHFAVAVTGIAGPGGGSPDKPVGTVCFAVARRAGGLQTARRQFAGDREQVRLQSVGFALELLMTTVQP